MSYKNTSKTPPRSSRFGGKFIRVFNLLENNKYLHGTTNICSNQYFIFCNENFY